MLIKTGFHKWHFFEFSFTCRWFFIEYLKIAASEFFCGKKMIIGVRVLMKKTEEPSFSKKNCGNCCRCFWFEIGIARKQWCSILKAYWQSPEKTRFLQLISFIRFYEWLGKLSFIFIKVSYLQAKWVPLSDIVLQNDKDQNLVKSALQKVVLYSSRLSFDLHFPGF